MPSTQHVKKGHRETHGSGGSHSQWIHSQRQPEDWIPQVGIDVEDGYFACVAQVDEPMSRQNMRREVIGNHMVQMAYICRRSIVRDGRRTGSPWARSLWRTAPPFLPTVRWMKCVRRLGLTTFPVVR